MDMSMRARRHILKAIELLKIETEEKAIEELNIAISLVPLSGEAFLLRADAHRALRQFESALKDYVKAEQLEFDQCRIKLGMGICQSKLLLHTEALNSFKEALNANPGCANAYYWRGRAHYDLRKFEQAIADLNKAITIDKDHYDAKAFLSLARSSLATAPVSATLLQLQDRMTSRYFLEAHPQAKSLLKEPFFWTYDDVGPVGGDIGSDCLEEFWDWRKSNREASMQEMPQSLLSDWGYSEHEIEKVASGSASDAVGENHLLANIYDDVVIAITFCQFMIDGYLDSGLKNLALKAIDRQSEPAVLEFRAGDNKDYIEAKEKIRTALLAMPGRISK